MGRGSLRSPIAEDMVVLFVVSLFAAFERVASCLFLSTQKQ